MSRDEVKREHRELEGEPAHKAERRRLHRETMHEQALCDVSGADFVVVQSGVMAAAVRHESDGPQAPVVMVKGERKVAQAIENAARTAHVPVFADPDLARALVAVEEGEEIPEALYEQVAEWLVRARTLGQSSR
jgi:flagellar biosynthesis protein FlhB